MREVSGKTQVVAVALVTALCMIGDSMLYVVLPLFWKEAGLTSLWEVGVLLAVNRFIRVPLGPLVGKWYERSGGRTGLILAVGLAFLTTLSYSLEGFWLWLVMRCLWGVAWTFLRLGAYSLIVTVSEGHNRGQLMGLYNGLYRLGSLGGMLVGAILASWYGLSVASIALAVPSLFAAILVFRYIRPSFSSQDQTGVNRMVTGKRMWNQGAVLMTMITALLVTMVYQGIFTSTLSRVVEVRDPFIVAGGVVLGAAVIASLVQGIRWGWEPWAAPLVGTLSDKHGRTKMFIVTLLVASFLFAALQGTTRLQGTNALLIWFAILFGIQLTATIITTVLDTIAADVAARQANSHAWMTQYSVVSDLGAALGPLLAFWLDEHVGLSVMYIGIAIVLFMLALAWLGRPKLIKMENVS
ncbi:MFS transporter [Brevibacillus porteri]|uniref:Arabinose ABC transporter permease n=1 Tax=Brevibacillus porteri TaxID=2126350 RepID=A0ABX5FLI1_9BACL|nr:MFS transporter [Brevibacillus porteri]MED1799472.1 MFS transporter [Brevibacillus porteri]MED2131946.1 MFS transporter [Brevibacillus porteri]MED2744833.1 MFS transporter [Brevibacillus porteri]MED2817331.1 MFS transporter [Brevibacillus porteri]MED2893235.1 MFS transporter [Brevibacillus porteri]